jgi:SAM-dependent methyltransferase
MFDQNLIDLCKNNCLIEADILSEVFSNITTREKSIMILGASCEEAIASLYELKVSSLVCVDRKNISEEFYSIWGNQVLATLDISIVPKFITFEFGLGDTIQCPLIDHSIDLIYCSNVLYQINNEKGGVGLSLTLKEIKRLLDPNGYFVAFEPSTENLSPILERYFIVNSRKSRLLDTKLIHTCS